jgi:hypothetical protein
MAAQRKQLSLDANFMFDLAGEEDCSHDEASLSPVHPVHPRRLLCALGG